MTIEYTISWKAHSSGHQDHLNKVAEFSSLTEFRRYADRMRSDGFSVRMFRTLPA